MLPKSKRLTKKREFAKLGIQGRSVYGRFSALRVHEVKSGGPKVAFITSTKVMKLSVHRNRAKRRMREVLRQVWDELPVNVHLLFILKPEAKDAAYADLIADVRHMVEKIPEALKRPPRLSPRAQRQRRKGTRS